MKNIFAFIIAAIGIFGCQESGVNNLSDSGMDMDADTMDVSVMDADVDAGMDSGMDLGTVDGGNCVSNINQNYMVNPLIINFSESGTRMRIQNTSTNTITVLFLSVEASKYQNYRVCDGSLAAGCDLSTLGNSFVGSVRIDPNSWITIKNYLTPESFLPVSLCY